MADASSPTGDGIGPVAIEEQNQTSPNPTLPNSALPKPTMETRVNLRGVTVAVCDDRVDSGPVAIDPVRWAELAATSLEHLGERGELQLTFVDPDEIAMLNRDHMGVDGPTDVLSFPLDGVDDGDEVDSDAQGTHVGGGEAQGVPRLLGDIVICPEVAAQAAPTHAGTIDDELALLVVHGVLHVLGYDHADPADGRAMRAAEAELLSAYHWDGPPPAGFRHEHDDSQLAEDVSGRTELR